MSERVSSCGLPSQASRETFSLVYRAPERRIRLAAARKCYPVGRHPWQVPGWSCFVEEEDQVEAPHFRAQADVPPTLVTNVQVVHSVLQQAIQHL